jgi:pimeloyl-ACP methyl ester carboxylesterase
MDVGLLFISLGVFFLLTTAISTGLVVWKFSEVPIKPDTTDCPEVRYNAFTPGAAGLIYDEVQIRGPLGDYPAWVVPSGDGATWAVMVHGRSGDRTSWLATLPLLADAGITTLSVTLRNDDGAPKTADGFERLGLDEWRDLNAAVRWAISRGAKKIYIFARSAGAATTLQFMRSSSYAAEVSGLVFEDPVLDWYETLMHNRPKSMPQWVAKLVLKVTAWRARIHWEVLDVEQWPPNHRPPMLLMHTRADEVVPYSKSVYFSRKFKDEWPISFVPMEGRHGHSRDFDSKYHDALIRTWLGLKPIEEATA